MRLFGFHSYVLIHLFLWEERCLYPRSEFLVGKHYESVVDGTLVSVDALLCDLG